MDWSLTPRDRIVLSVFLCLLVAGAWGYIRWATAPAPSGRTLQPTTSRTLERATEPVTATPTVVKDVAPTPLAEDYKSPATLPRRDYRFIAERNIFQPATEKVPSPNKPSSSPRRARSSSQPSGGLAAPPPLPPAPPPPPTTPTPTQMAARPANLTATGVARIGEDTYVLLENPQTRDIAFVRVGEYAFGYQVNRVGENYVEVQQGDTAYRITLGEGKQERRILAAGGGPRPPFGGPPGGPFGGPSGPQQFGGRQEGQRGQGQQQGRSEWIMRAVEAWNQLPEFVRNRILQRIGEFWQQLPPDQQQQIIKQFQSMGVNFTPPGR